MKNDIANNSGDRIKGLNPLSIIALFVSFIEAVATISLKIVADFKNVETLQYIVIFIIAYPTLIAIIFFLLLWFKREALYAPGDYPDPHSFIDLLNKLDKKVARIELKQEVSQFDSTWDSDDIYPTIDKLISIDEVTSAVRIGRLYLDRKKYDDGIQIFTYIMKKIPETHRKFYKVLANLAYCYIGKEQYEMALESLNRIKTLKYGYNYKIWHLLALAFANYKSGKMKEYKNIMQEIKAHKDYNDIDFKFFKDLYKDIASDLNPLKT